jgi:hypothetical protein
MKFLKELLEGYNDLLDFDDELDMQDYGHPSFNSVLEYIDLGLKNPKLSDYLWNEYPDYYFWDAEDEKRILKSLEWINDAPSSRKTIKKVVAQLKELERSGRITTKDMYMGDS